jgi:hypothetical protein
MRAISAQGIRENLSNGISWFTFSVPRAIGFLHLEAITQDPRFSLIESRVVFAAPPNRLAIATHALMSSR